MQKGEGKSRVRFRRQILIIVLLGLKKIVLGR